MKIGLSYDQGTPKYRLYTGALMAAAEQAGIDVQPFWLAGADRETDWTAIQTMDGLLLTGGADVEPSRYGRGDAEAACTTYPGRDDIEWAILDAALARRLPMLAICRGMQLFNVHAGGTLHPDVPTASAHQLDDDERHLVMCESTAALALLIGENDGQVTSSHHQAVAKLGHGLQIAARHADGTIEAIEWARPMRKPWLAAVQWHPERMGLDEPFAGAVFRGFLQAVSLARP
ncbi:MAG TPA: gamma-glutamyl-gamma-aminobutyrate hydrolase family protein [Alphaproteobacteria bacterium]|nr:gamma-glutamyl-gamma-aminobutyrate hydrolase family protein [Alphaproteobacteria bacterium]